MTWEMPGWIGRCFAAPGRGAGRRRSNCRPERAIYSFSVDDGERNLHRRDPAALVATRDAARYWGVRQHGVRGKVGPLTLRMLHRVRRKYSSGATMGLAFTRTGLVLSVLPMLWLAGRSLPPGRVRRRRTCSATYHSRIDETLKRNPVLIVASNSTGGVMGKMIRYRYRGRGGRYGQNGETSFRFVFFHSVAACLVGLLTLAGLFGADDFRGRAAL